MKYSKLTQKIEDAIDALDGGETQGKDAERLCKLVAQQIKAWREKRCFYQARDEKPPLGEINA